MISFMHDYQDLITIFNRCFSESYNTRLIKGDDEPIYLPADSERSFHGIYFAHGFFASALHECAHWLIAGPERRQQIDFGYWYVPDGRTAEQQNLFQRVEVKPQAIEWILSRACGHRFQVSVDNLNGLMSEGAVLDFKQAVYRQVQDYCDIGLPQRTALFRQNLCEFYHTPLPLDRDDFCQRDDVG